VESRVIPPEKHDSCW